MLLQIATSIVSSLVGVLAAWNPMDGIALTERGLMRGLG